MKAIVIVNRLAQDRDEVIVAGPFADRESAQAFIEEAHDHDDDCSEDETHLLLDDVESAEVMLINEIF